MDKSVAGIVISEVLGWKATDDSEHILVGMKDATGNEFALAISPPNLINIALGALGAAGQAQSQRGATLQGLFAFQPDWYEVGQVEGTEDVALTPYLPDKTALPFQIPKVMAERLAETLGAMLGMASISQTHGTKLN